MRPPIDPLRLPSCWRSQDLGKSLPDAFKLSPRSPAAHLISSLPSARSTCTTTSVPSRSSSPPTPKPRSTRRKNPSTGSRATFAAPTRGPHHEPDRGTTAQPPDRGERHSRLSARFEAVRTCLTTVVSFDSENFDHFEREEQDRPFRRIFQEMQCSPDRRQEWPGQPA